MSRILNRPMFRGGGKVSSYGTGIATGLAKGGSVNTPKRGIVDGPGRYSQTSMSGLSNYKDIFGNTKNKVIKTGADVVQAAKDKASLGKNFLNKLKLPPGKNLESRLGKGIESIYKTVVPKGNQYTRFNKFLTKQLPTISKNVLKPSVGVTSVFAPTSIIGESNRPKTYAALEYMKSMNQSGAFDETAMEGEYEGFTEEFDKLNDVTKYTPIPDERGFFNKYINPMGFVAGLNPEDKTAEEINKIIEGDTNKNNPQDPPPFVPPPGLDEPVPLTMKEQVAKDKALFADLLGEGEARGKDVSDMLLRFAGSGGDTVGEKFQQYIGAEAMAGPSRTEKINQAAASLAINDYIAGKRSKENMEMMIAKTEKDVDYRFQKQDEKEDLKNHPFVKAVGMEATAQKKKPSDNNVIASVIYKQTEKAPTIVSDFANEVYGADTNIDETKLNVGLNIVTFKNAKIVIRKKPDSSIEIATEYPVY